MCKCFGLSQTIVSLLISLFFVCCFDQTLIISKRGPFLGSRMVDICSKRWNIFCDSSSSCHTFPAVCNTNWLHNERPEKRERHVDSCFCCQQAIKRSRAITRGRKQTVFCGSIEFLFRCFCDVKEILIENVPCNVGLLFSLQELEILLDGITPLGRELLGVHA